MTVSRSKISVSKDRKTSRAAKTRQSGTADLPKQIDQLKTRLKTARMQQQASAEILRAIANASGDADRSLQRISEITADLFNA